ncbi:hypothetical protein [Leuconostoc citreum]
MEKQNRQQKTVQAIESEDVENLKLHLKYSSQELELPDEYTIIIVPKHRTHDNSVMQYGGTLPLNSDVLPELAQRLNQEKQDLQSQTVYEMATFLTKDVLSYPGTRENPEMIKAIAELIKVMGQL